MISRSDRRSSSLSVAVGTICVAVGALLTLRPFSSLGALVVVVAVALALTGAGELVTAGSSPDIYTITAALIEGPSGLDPDSVPSFGSAGPIIVV